MLIVRMKVKKFVIKHLILYRKVNVIYVRKNVRLHTAGNEDFK